MLQCSGNSIPEYRNDFVHLTYSFSLTAQMALNWLSHRLAVWLSHLAAWLYCVRGMLYSQQTVHKPIVTESPLVDIGREMG